MEQTVTQLRSPERVLSTIAATARLSGIAAPRRIAFSEPRPGEPLAVLSLSWESLADMRPWLSVFHIDSHRPGATTVYGDYAGWSLMLTSPAPVAICFCEVVHPLGCPGDLADAPECPSCGVLGGSHQESCYAVEPPFRTHDNGKPHLTDVVRHLNATLGARFTDLPSPAKARICVAISKAHADRAEATRIAESMLPSRVDVEAAAQIPVTVIEVSADPSPARHIDLTSVGRYFADKWPHLNALQRARLVEACDIAGWFGDWTAAYRSVMDDPTLTEIADDARLIVSELDDIAVVSVAQLAAVADVGGDETIAYVLAHRGETVPVVDVVTVDPDLDASRGDAEIARIGVPVDLTRVAGKRMTGVIVNLTAGTVEGITGGAS